MLSKHLRATFLVALLSTYALQAHAGASLFVDDATLTPAGRCQVESWARTYTPGQELTAVPACTVDGTEWSLGVSQLHNASSSTLLGPGIKRVFRDFDTHDWGVGLSVGTAWNVTREHLDGWNINVPMTFALDSQRHVVMNTNVGWAQSPGKHGAVTGGIGFEVAVADHWAMLAEAYRDTHVAGEAGIRRYLSEDASFDVLVGTDHGPQRSGWITVGLNIVLPKG